LVIFWGGFLTGGGKTGRQIRSKARGSVGTDLTHLNVLVLALGQSRGGEGWGKEYMREGRERGGKEKDEGMGYG